MSISSFIWPDKLSLDPYRRCLQLDVHILIQHKKGRFQLLTLKWRLNTHSIVLSRITNGFFIGVFMDSHDAVDVDDDIFKAATLCRQRFEEYLQQQRLYQEQVADLQRQFLTWANFLGVFAPVKICLDTRLADAPDIKELVISMLTVLERNLKRGIGSQFHHDSVFLCLLHVPCDAS